MLSLVTNVCSIDTVRIRQMLPSWLRVFGSRLNEIAVVIDETPPTGRIAALHGNASSDIEAVRAELESWRKKDSRITLHPLDSQNVNDSCRHWFIKGKPLRCQAGTPISAFTCAIDVATSPLILRCDCDMLFYDNGWVNAAAELLESGRADLVEPPRLGVDSAENNLEVSTRAFMLHRPSFENLLPIMPHKLDLPRRMHRWLHGRPPWLALEQMLDVERRCGTASPYRAEQRTRFQSACQHTRTGRIGRFRTCRGGH